MAVRQYRGCARRADQATPSPAREARKRVRMKGTSIAIRASPTGTIRNPRIGRKPRKAADHQQDGQRDAHQLRGGLADPLQPAPRPFRQVRVQTIELPIETFFGGHALANRRRAIPFLRHIVSFDLIATSERRTNRSGGPAGGRARPSFTAERGGRAGYSRSQSGIPPSWQSAIDWNHSSMSWSKPRCLDMA